MSKRVIAAFIGLCFVLALAAWGLTDEGAPLTVIIIAIPIVAISFTIVGGFMDRRRDRNARRRSQLLRRL